MINVENSKLLESQQALQKLAQKPLSGVYSLRLREVLAAVEDRLNRLQEVQNDLQGREDLSPEEADEEWRNVLEDTLEIPDEEPLPREAVEGIQISAGTLVALDWLIGNPEQ